MTAAAEALLVVLAGLPGTGDGGVASLLAQVSLEPASHGDRVYVGQVYPLQGPRAAPRFAYERRVRWTEAGATSTCLTREGSEVVLVDIAEHGPDYALRTFTEYQLQLQEVAQVEVRGETVAFRVVDRAGTRAATETVTLPVLVGPTVYGFLYRHWGPLLAGEVVPFRYAVVSRLETVGFELVRVPAPPGQVQVEMRASSPLVRLVVAPIVITFTEQGALLAYDGRTPMKTGGPGRWTDFEGHVEYALEPAPFR